MIPEGWESTTLGKIVAESGGSIQTGPFGSQLHASDYVLQGIPSVMPANIGENFIIEDGIARISEDDARRLQRHRMEPGDIVYSRRGDVERRALIREDNAGWLCGTGCLRVHFGSHGENDPAFVSYQLGTEWTREWIVRHAVGATMLNLNTGILSAVPLERPPLHEQRAIAEVLGALDDKIAANSKLASTVDSLLAAHLDGLFRSLEPEEVRLGDVVDLNPDKVVPKVGGGLRYVDIASVGVGTVEWPSLLSWVDAPGRARRGLGVGDILWSTVRPNRRSHFLNLEDDPLLVASTGLAVIRARDEHWPYLYEVLRRPEFTAYLESVAEGSAYPAVKPEQIRDGLVPWVGRLEVSGFDSLAAPLRRRVANLQRENRTLAATRDALLPQLMSGKLRVKDAERIVSEVA